MHRLESIVINVNLQDAASVFTEQHTWNVMDCISFPGPHKKNCNELAFKIFDRLRGEVPESHAPKHLELRFPCRLWDDRCQVMTLGYSVRVKRDKVGVVKLDAEKPGRITSHRGQDFYGI